MLNFLYSFGQGGLWAVQQEPHGTQEDNTSWAAGATKASPLTSKQVQNTVPLGSAEPAPSTDELLGEELTECALPRDLLLVCRQHEVDGDSSVALTI